MRGGGPVAGHVVAIKRALPGEIGHERADGLPQCRPEGFTVGLEHGEFGAANKALLDVEREPPHRNVFVIVRQQVRAAQRARAPHHRTHDRKIAQTVDAQGIELPVLVIVEAELEPIDAADAGRDAGRRLPHPAQIVGRREDAGDRAAGREGFDLAGLGIRFPDPREVDGAIARLQFWSADSKIGRLDLVDPALAGVVAPCLRWVEDQHRAALQAIQRRGLIQRLEIAVVGIRRIRRDAHEVEQIEIVERVDAGAQFRIAGEVRGSEIGAVGAAGKRDIGNGGRRGHRQPIARHAGEL